MTPSWLQIVILALLQGAAELLPVSSSAHVILAEKLMGLDPSSPALTFLLVMLHTGTMFAVIVYFWKAWGRSYFSSMAQFLAVVRLVVAATAITGVLGLGLKVVIEKVILGGGAKAEVESLFSNLYLVAGALDAAGLLIIVSGLLTRRQPADEETPVSLASSIWIGVVQALSLPFRGFSRSGSTISTAMLLGVGKRPAEEFSFALAVVLTPVVVFLELHRLLKDNATAAEPIHLGHLLLPGVVGMACSFVAGLLALRFLSSWLEGGKWHFFGFYCIVFAGVVFGCAWAGY